MIVNTKSWWYKLGSEFNSKLKYEEVNNLCQLVRSLVWGYILTVLFSSAIIQGAIIPMLIALFAALTPFSIGESSNYVNHFGMVGSIEWVLLLLLTLSLIVKKWLEEFADYLEDRRDRIPYNRRSKRKPPGIIRSYLKRIKDKTCPLVEYE